ncbi:TadE/TadG family type IV pilus assembly protein [Hoeflea olei]|uniref:TadE-like domain-containing protein n=1 Tax=Hoeflea olei TaxID=1480615 RepID=A0A1C1YX28_9HYPH|nr:TadE/TadG family type IV pilus assembly protein [Hoeflea olei]OCW57970.1 hypothetical protein AWJ14_04070 [Hoeflea olei]
MEKLFFRDREGSSAIEFALLAPVFLLVVFSMIGYGIYLSAAHAVQQLAADAARTAIAGISANERQRLATEFVGKAAPSHAFLTAENLQVIVKDDPANAEQFTVTLSYDARNLPIWNLYAVAMPSSRIDRFATIRIGGI